MKNSRNWKAQNQIQWSTVRHHSFRLPSAIHDSEQLQYLHGNERSHNEIEKGQKTAQKLLALAIYKMYGRNITKVSAVAGKHVSLRWNWKI